MLDIQILKLIEIKYSNYFKKSNPLDFLFADDAVVPVQLTQIKKNKPKSETESTFKPEVFKDIFIKAGWEIYISALEKTEPPLLNPQHEFIGKLRSHKGVICSWIKSLQTKGIIKQNVNRSKLALVLNNEFKNFNIGKDGKTFDNVSQAFNNDFKKQLINLTTQLPLVTIGKYR